MVHGLDKDDEVGEKVIPDLTDIANKVGKTQKPLKSSN